jgi:hypothetical protein
MDMCMYDTAVHISAQLLAANIHARKDQAAQSSRIAFFCLPTFRELFGHKQAKADASLIMTVSNAHDKL